jgi:hypothetical protein
VIFGLTYNKVRVDRNEEQEDKESVKFISRREASFLGGKRGGGGRRRRERNKSRR